MLSADFLHTNIFGSWIFICLVAFQTHYAVICETVASQSSISARGQCHPIEEFFDPVINSCARCSDICWQMQSQQLRSNIQCRFSCPDYFDHRMRHLLSSQGLSSSRARWTVTTTSSYHDDVTGSEYSFLMNPLFWVSAVSLFISIIATAVIAFVCCRHQRARDNLPSSVRHQDTGFNEGKRRFSSYTISQLKSTNRTNKPTEETMSSSGFDSIDHSSAKVASDTKQLNTDTVAMTAIVMPNTHLGRSVVPSSSSSASSSSSSSQQKVEAVDKVCKVDSRNHVYSSIRSIV